MFNCGFEVDFCGGAWQGNLVRERRSRKRESGPRYGAKGTGYFLYMDGSQSEADEEATFTIVIEWQCAHTALFSYFLYGADVQPLTLLGVKGGKAQVLFRADKEGG